MRPEARKLLWDMRDAAEQIVAFTRDKSAADYLADRQLRWSVERGFEIIGEALSQLSKIEPAIADQISERRKIVSFRNILIHGYSQISNAKTWAIVEHGLPILRGEVDSLLNE